MKENMTQFLSIILFALIVVSLIFISDLSYELPEGKEVSGADSDVSLGEDSIKGSSVVSLTITEEKNNESREI